MISVDATQAAESEIQTCGENVTELDEIASESFAEREKENKEEDKLEESKSEGQVEQIESFFTMFAQSFSPLSSSSFIALPIFFPLDAFCLPSGPSVGMWRLLSYNRPETGVRGRGGRGEKIEGVGGQRRGSRKQGRGREG